MGESRVGHVQWGVKPPKSGGQHISLIQPKPKEELELVVLDERIVSVVLHWHPDGNGGGRSLPCSGLDPRCPGCEAKLASRWKGYLACVVRKTRKIVIAALTPSAIDSCPIIAEDKVALRAGTLWLTRKGIRVNSPMVARFQSSSPWQSNALPFINTQEQLMRIWAGETGSNASVARRAQFDGKGT
jgi:hypothetical protein